MHFYAKFLLSVGRYYVDENWRQKKIEAIVPVPEFLDLTSYKAFGGLQPGESPIPDVDAESSRSTAIVPDATLVAELMAMGFSENSSKRALLGTNNSNIEAAAQWLFDHIDDNDFNDPIVPSATNNVHTFLPSEEGVSMLCAMGFTDVQAEAALLSTQNNIERFVIFFIVIRNLNIPVFLIELQTGYFPTVMIWMQQ